MHDQWDTYRSADVEVPLTPSDGPPGLLGSVLGSGQAREWVQFLMSRQPKDALLYLRKWLKEAARKENVQLKSGRSKLTGTMLPHHMLCFAVRDVHPHMIYQTSTGKCGVQPDQAAGSLFISTQWLTRLAVC